MSQQARMRVMPRHPYNSARHKKIDNPQGEEAKAVEAKEAEAEPPASAEQRFLVANKSLSLDALRLINPA